MQFSPFEISRFPQIVFGRGSLHSLPERIPAFGRHVLLVTGGKSFRNSEHHGRLTTALSAADIEWHEATVEDEPSPMLIDQIVARFHGRGVRAVVGIGGGSVLDAAKAIAGLLPSCRSVLEHLEDVGKGLPFEGPTLPFIAVPTTAGTGSEATKNAVLSVRGPDGYKKSFRHVSLVARLALIDPDLLQGCPRHLMAGQGMDAFTQLLESYVSLRANPFTDGLAWSGLQAVAGGFFNAVEGEGKIASDGRAAMAYGALVSGITLAQVGLGSVHGLAQPLGSLFPIPHGVACGSTVAVATAVNCRALEQRDPESPALAKYAQVGRLLAGDDSLNPAAARVALLEQLEQWTARLAIPRLGRYGVTVTDIERIVAGSRNNSMKTNPIQLTDEEVAEIVWARL